MNHIILTVILAWSIKGSHSIQTGSKSGVITFNKTIISPKYYHREPIDVPPSNRIELTYQIQFSKDQCCPTVGFDVSPTRDNIHQSDFCYEGRFTYTASYVRHYIYTKEEFPFSGCTAYSGHHVCTGTRTLAAIYPQYWTLIAGFDCDEKQSLNITVMVNLTYFEDYKSRCEPFYNKVCDKYINYSHTSYPNAIGQTSLREANEALALISFILPIEGRCYQHPFEFLCRIFIPECQNEELIYPCKQMCEDVRKACHELFTKYEQVFYCTNFKDSLNPSECFNKPVTCPRINSPFFGRVRASGFSVLNTSTYECNNGFKLEGDATRTCLYTGIWNGTAPVCRPVVNMNIVIVISVLILLILIVVIACLCYRKTIKLLIFHHVRVDAIRLDNLTIQKTVFVTFSSQDSDQVNDEFLPRLRQELPIWNIQTYQQDFAAGRPLLECMREGVWESQAVLVLLTENYIASAMCTFEFTEAQTRMVKDKTFKLIVILFHKKGKDVVSLNDLSDNLKKYVISRVHLQLGEALFWNKLRRALAK